MDQQVFRESYQINTIELKEMRCTTSWLDMQKRPICPILQKVFNHSEVFSRMSSLNQNDNQPGFQLAKLQVLTYVASKTYVIKKAYFSLNTAIGYQQMLVRQECHKGLPTNHSHFQIHNSMHQNQTNHPSGS